MNKDDLISRAEKVVCPRCGAAPKKKCFDTPHTKRNPHSERLDKVR